MLLKKLRDGGTVMDELRSCNEKIKSRNMELIQENDKLRRYIKNLENSTNIRSIEPLCNPARLCNRFPTGRTYDNQFYGGLMSEEKLDLFGSCRYPHSYRPTSSISTLPMPLGASSTINSDSNAIIGPSGQGGISQHGNTLSAKNATPAPRSSTLQSQGESRGTSSNRGDKRTTNETDPGSESYTSTTGTGSKDKRERRKDRKDKNRREKIKKSKDKRSKSRKSGKSEKTKSKTKKSKRNKKK
ncbi:DgyrCDS12200 [Dimorphilus gyrociliatus]|uniref:DgyrCDS12200 n=1 Tax=Dimorphilus gyrociliatus TaxID=2664684 RepID=A0A7I8W7J7_9ANNE|nr:DgyrCDS12200 [Dimorphilus gyrociliatus]